MIPDLINIVKKVPFVGVFAGKIYRLIRPREPFPGSSNYWESRYAEGGNSGIGSYRQLAEFKAGIINDFVRDHLIRLVIEFGCGDGNQLSLGKYPSYIGFDVSKTVIGICRQRFAVDSTKSFFVYDTVSFEDKNRIFYAELVLSLDVIYHLVEDSVFMQYMNHIFAASSKFVVIYSSDIDLYTAEHVRHRRFTNWIAMNQPDWSLVKKIENPYKFDPQNPADKFDVSFFIYEKKRNGINSQ